MSNIPAGVTHCQRCGCELNGEAALLVWCHSCADAAPPPSHSAAGNLYLIAHKVRGEVAFDTAEQMVCQVCEGLGSVRAGGCHECNSTSRWWIIPTSGHRAYPFWTMNLNLEDNEVWQIPPMPEELRDHYVTSAPAQRPPRDLTPNLEDI